ncbi:tautomerase family protein [Rhodococcus sp. KRD162]|uniref:tautomerase family protein n=1 Tax=Rhodococcus sp. KRD162 TaxID=2729725 RepID=UPI0019D0A9E6|nr:tautomerase family protein [Rhodococcus sp. KRD162]
MPLWTIYSSPGTLGVEDKKDLAERITERYYQDVGLPRFYVVTIFTEVQPIDFYVGGEPIRSGVRVVIDHIARSADGEQGRRRTAKWVRSILQPTLGGRDFHWEFHVDETPEELWMIDGLVPPAGGSAGEQLWRSSNTPEPYY